MLCGTQLSFQEGQATDIWVVSNKIFCGEDTAVSSLISAIWKRLYHTEKAKERNIISGKHTNTVSSKSFLNLDMCYKLINILYLLSWTYLFYFNLFPQSDCLVSSFITRLSTDWPKKSKRCLRYSREIYILYNLILPLWYFPTLCPSLEGTYGASDLGSSHQ